MEYGIIVFDVNDLKYINDTFGHEAGDRWIKYACQLICDVFEHSPVYRTGGDEFVVCLENSDYVHREELMYLFNTTVEQNKKDNKVVVAAGCAVYKEHQDFSFSSVCDRADRRMYARKTELKKKN